MMEKEYCIEEIEEAKTSFQKYLLNCNRLLDAFNSFNEIMFFLSETTKIPMNLLEVACDSDYGFLTISYPIDKYRCKNKICNAHRYCGGISGNGILVGNEESLLNEYLVFDNIRPVCNNCPEFEKEEESKKFNENVLKDVKNKFREKFLEINKYFLIDTY